MFDDREGVEQEFRLAIGKPGNVGAHPLHTSSHNQNQDSVDGSLIKGNNFDLVQTMLIVDVKFGQDSTFVSLGVQRPQLLVALDFLLAVVEFFVPTVSSMLSVEENRSDMLEAIVIDQSVYKQPCPEFSLSPQKPLIVDDDGFDNFIYDGDGGILYLKDRQGFNLKAASTEAIIYIGNGKKLQFRNVVIKVIVSHFNFFIELPLRHKFWCMTKKLITLFFFCRVGHIWILVYFLEQTVAIQL